MEKVLGGTRKGDRYSRDSVDPDKVGVVGSTFLSSDDLLRLRGKTQK